MFANLIVTLFLSVVFSLFIFFALFCFIGYAILNSCIFLSLFFSLPLDLSYCKCLLVSFFSQCLICLKFFLVS